MDYFFWFVVPTFLLELYSGEACDNYLITDFSIDNCIAKQDSTNTYYYMIDDQSCTPYCNAYTNDGYYGKKCPCIPGYICDKRCSASNEAIKHKCDVDNDCKKFVRSKCTSICVGDPGTCMAYYANTTDYRDNKFTAIKFKPKCQNDGYWKTKQCKGGISGRCMCFNKLGTRLFGEARYSKSKTMTCACSRRRSELVDEGVTYATLHCNSLGNFEKLQCDSGFCWCAEEQTGDLTSIVVPEKALKKLSCYDVTSVGNQYLRQCDSIKYAMSLIERTLKKHGVVYVNLGTTLCDGDGAYGVYNISDGIAYCTKRDGTKIGGYQSDSGTDIKTLSCRCARDLLDYGHSLTCEGNGNYRIYQSTIQDNTNYVFCVDADGFQNSNLESEILDCKVYY